MQNKPRKGACQSHRGGRAVSQAVKHRNRAGVIAQHALVGACAAALVRRRRSAFEKLCTGSRTNCVLENAKKLAQF